jgi:DNA-binding phage protein
MPFEDSFDQLERLLLAKSTDYEKMRALVKEMRQMREIARMLGPAQDNLYASIARGHRKALVHLESGDTAAAMVEMAGAVSWFLRRFQGSDPLALAKAPKVAEELREATQLAERSELLREALRQESYDIHA